MSYLTSFYFSGGESAFRLEDEEMESQDSGDEKSDNGDHSPPSHQIYEFIGADINDISYFSVLKSLKYNISFDTGKVEDEEEKQSPIVEAVERHRNPIFKVRKELIPVASKTNIILNYCFKLVPIKKEAERVDMSVQAIKNLIYEFNVVSRVTRKARKSINLNRTKFIQSHFQILAKFSEGKRESGFTALEARKHFIQYGPGLETISESTVKRHLHSDLKLCFKKLRIIYPKKAGNESKSSLVMWLKGNFWLIDNRSLSYLCGRVLDKSKHNKYIRLDPKGETGKIVRKTLLF